MKYTFRISAFLVFSVIYFAAACKDPAAVRKYQREEMLAKRKVLDSAVTKTDSLFSESILNTEFLMGIWTLDIEELKTEVKRNAQTEKQADVLIKDFDKKYSSVKMEFYTDKRFALYLNDERFIGFWGVSSDNISYYVQFADDYIELHEVISLTNDRLVEIPVAEMRNAGMPLRQLVFLKE